MKKSLKFITICLTICLLLCGCGKSKKETPKEKKNDQKPIVTTPEKIEIVDVDSKSRPIAIMINNIADVWGYQTGIQDAYLVYEIIVEGGYTRLMALFKEYIFKSM